MGSLEGNTYPFRTNINLVLIVYFLTEVLII